MEAFNFTSESPDQTTAFGKRLASKLKKGSIVCLHGDLGSGKTTLVKGLAQGLKFKKENVNSPTFVLMNIYEGKLPIHHFDLYRLENPQEIHGIGFDEFVYGDGVSVIEWAEKLEDLYPEECLKIELKHDEDQKRSVSCQALGEKYTGLIKELA